MKIDIKKIRNLKNMLNKIYIFYCLSLVTSLSLVFPILEDNLFPKSKKKNKRFSNNEQNKIIV